MAGLVDVWYDSPDDLKVHSALHPRNPLCTLRRGTFTNADGRVFSDSGVSHNFVSRSFVESNGIECAPIKGVMHCAGSSKIASVGGMINARIVLKGLKADLKLLVIDPPPGLDMCLGDTWLNQHKAVIDYESQCLLLQKGKRKDRLLSMMSVRISLLLLPSLVLSAC